MKRVLIDTPIYEGTFDKVKSIGGYEIEVVPYEAEVRRLDSNLISDIDYLFCSFPPENFDEMKKLKWIQLTSAGYFQVTHLNCPARGIEVSNSSGAFDVTIAEWNICMMIQLLRDMKQLFYNQENKVWDRDARFQKELRGATLGIWGYGNIGRETARQAKALGLKVKVLTRNGLQPRKEHYTVENTGDPEGILPDADYIYEDREEFLKDLDFLCLSLSLTPETHGIIGEEELKALPAHCHILNPARGHLIEESALVRALEKGWIAGAALDTHYTYPLPKEHPLWNMKNVILTPHISGSTSSPHYEERIWDIFYTNLKRLKGGLSPINRISLTA